MLAQLNGRSQAARASAHLVNYMRQWFANNHTASVPRAAQRSPVLVCTFGWCVCVCMRWGATSSARCVCIISIWSCWRLDVYGELEGLTDVQRVCMWYVPVRRADNKWSLLKSISILLGIKWTIKKKHLYCIVIGGSLHRASSMSMCVVMNFASAHIFWWLFLCFSLYKDCVL